MCYSSSKATHHVPVCSVAVNTIPTRVTQTGCALRYSLSRDYLHNMLPLKEYLYGKLYWLGPICEASDLYLEIEYLSIKKRQEQTINYVKN